MSRSSLDVLIAKTKFAAGDTYIKARYGSIEQAALSKWKAQTGYVTPKVKTYKLGPDAQMKVTYDKALIPPKTPKPQTKIAKAKTAAKIEKAERIKVVKSEKQLVKQIQATEELALLQKQEVIQHYRSAMQQIPPRPVSATKAKEATMSLAAYAQISKQLFPREQKVYEKYYEYAEAMQKKGYKIMEEFELSYEPTTTQVFKRLEQQEAKLITDSKITIDAVARTQIQQADHKLAQKLVQLEAVTQRTRFKETPKAALKQQLKLLTGVVPIISTKELERIDQRQDYVVGLQEKQAQDLLQDYDTRLKQFTEITPDIVEKRKDWDTPPLGGAIFPLFSTGDERPTKGKTKVTKKKTPPSLMALDKQLIKEVSKKEAKYLREKKQYTGLEVRHILKIKNEDKKLEKKAKQLTRRWL